MRRAGRKSVSAVEHGFTSSACIALRNSQALEHAKCCCSDCKLPDAATHCSLAPEGERDLTGRLRKLASMLLRSHSTVSFALNRRALSSAITDDMVVAGCLTLGKLSQAVFHGREQPVVSACLHRCARRAVTQAQLRQRESSATTTAPTAGTATAAATISMPTDTTSPAGPKLLKRRVALFVAYVGSSFRGILRHDR